MGTHYVQYSTLETPEQTKQRPASLEIDLFMADSAIHRETFLKANKELALKEISLFRTGWQWRMWETDKFISIKLPRIKATLQHSGNVVWRRCESAFHASV